MSSSKSIAGVTESPTREQEILELRRVPEITGRIDHRREERETALPAVAVKELQGAADSLGRKVDVQYDAQSGLVIFSVYDKEGKELIRRIPADEAIRLAQQIKENKSIHLSSLL